jgi:hypothetical protein
MNNCICGQQPSGSVQGTVYCTNTRCHRKPRVTRATLEWAQEAWDSLMTTLELRGEVEELQSQNESLRLDIELGQDRIK